MARVEGLERGESVCPRKKNSLKLASLKPSEHVGTFLLGTGGCVAHLALTQSGRLFGGRTKCPSNTYAALMKRSV